jgi:hypothetical protein
MAGLRHPDHGCEVEVLDRRQPRSCRLRRRPTR